MRISRWQSDKESIQSILIIRPGGMGDVILSTPALSALSREFPQAQVFLITNPGAAPLFESDPRLAEVLPFVTEQIESDRQAQLSELQRFEPLLKARQIDLAVDLRASDFSSRMACVSGARWRAGFRSIKRGLLLGLRYNLPASSPSRSSHRVGLARAVLKGLGIKASESPQVFVSHSERKWASEFLSQSGLPARAWLAIQPGASDPAKCWPADRYLAVARLAANSGIGVVVLGRSGQAEAELLLSRGRGQFLSAVGATSPPRLAALIHECDLFLGNDSGPMHLACAVGTPVIALFIATDPARYGPLGASHRVFDASATPERIWEAIEARLAASHPDTR